VLGKQLKLFSIQQDAGGGLVFWHPKGARVRRLMEDFWREAHTSNGYEMLYTPHMASLDLWKTSGHFDFYKEGMFDQMEVEGAQYQIKPMNCPFHVLVYKDEPRCAPAPTQAPCAQTRPSPQRGRALLASSEPTPPSTCTAALIL